MRERLLELAHLRKQLAERKAEMAQRRAAFNIETMTLHDSITEAETKTLALEAEIRDMAQDIHRRTGAKEIAPGVKVRTLTKVEYDMDTALAWARTSGVAVRLDTTAFERIARVSHLPFVNLREVPQVTIAADIEAALSNG